MAEVVSGAAQPAATTQEVHVTGRRVLATLVDWLVFAILFGVMSALFGTSSAGGGGVSASLNGLPALMFFVLVVLYYIILEGYLGQTLGKMLCGIKVVREGSTEEEEAPPPGLGAAAIRTVLRLIDGLFGYLVALIVVLVSGKRQRLGDMAAHTLVVRK